MWSLYVTINKPDGTELQNTFDFDTLAALLGYIESDCNNSEASSFVFVVVPPGGSY